MKITKLIQIMSLDLFILKIVSVLGPQFLFFYFYFYFYFLGLVDLTIYEIICLKEIENERKQRVHLYWKLR
jgi:hypothetical protein